MLPYDLQWPDRREAEGQTAPWTAPGLPTLSWTGCAAELLFRRIVKRLWNMERGWNRELFAIPPELQQSWRVTA